jgi:NADPH:quinone reductase-like Zn-dependent oxidoreductase
MEIPIVETAPATPKSILVIAGAGGVGTSVIQIAKKLLKLNVIATATRPETIKFCKDLGADHTISHREPLKPQLDALGLTSGVDYIYNCWSASEHWSQTVDIIKPGGKVCLIFTEDELPMKGLQFKRVSVVWEMMFARPIYNWEPELQNGILNRNSELIDSGVFYPRMTEKFAWNELPAALKKVEEGRAIGKISVTVPQ